MTKNYLFLLLGLLLAACSSDDKDEQPILVTNVVMPASGTVFKPGEKVTIMAKGFQDNDEIMFDIRWPLQDEVLHEAGETLEEVGSVSFYEGSGKKRIDYRDSVFLIPQEELQDYRLYGDFVISEGFHEGNWQVTFPIKEI